MVAFIDLDVLFCYIAACVTVSMRLALYQVDHRALIYRLLMSTSTFSRSLLLTGGGDGDEEELGGALITPKIHVSNV